MCPNCKSKKEKVIGKIKIVLEFKECNKCGQEVDNSENQIKLLESVIKGLKRK